MSSGECEENDCESETGQHENKQQTAEGEMTAHGKNYSRENGTCNARSKVRDVPQSDNTPTQSSLQQFCAQQLLL